MGLMNGLENLKSCTDGFGNSIRGSCREFNHPCRIVKFRYDIMMLRGMFNPGQCEEKVELRERRQF